MGKRELIALLCLSSWCPMIVVLLYFTTLRVCLQFFVVFFPDHTHLLFVTFFFHGYPCNSTENMMLQFLK